MPFFFTVIWYTEWIAFWNTDFSIWNLNFLHWYMDLLIWNTDFLIWNMHLNWVLLCILLVDTPIGREEQHYVLLFMVSKYTRKWQYTKFWILNRRAYCLFTPKWLILVKDASRSGSLPLACGLQPTPLSTLPSSSAPTHSQRLIHMVIKSLGYLFIDVCLQSDWACQTI